MQVTGLKYVPNSEAPSIATDRIIRFKVPGEAGFPNRAIFCTFPPDIETNTVDESLGRVDKQTESSDIRRGMEDTPRIGSITFNFVSVSVAHGLPLYSVRALGADDEDGVLVFMMAVIQRIIKP